MQPRGARGALPGVAAAVEGDAEAVLVVGPAVRSERPSAGWENKKKGKDAKTTTGNTTHPFSGSAAGFFFAAASQPSPQPSSSCCSSP